MPWAKNRSDTFVRFVGIAELLGALGLFLPLLTGILPWLTPLAAVGLDNYSIAGNLHRTSAEEGIQRDSDQHGFAGAVYLCSRWALGTIFLRKLIQSEIYKERFPC